MDLNFLASLLDEVALEGLDGITLPMLWVRLENRPNFPIALDDDSKAFLWECIAVHKDIDIFELVKPRKFVPIYYRYHHIDSELGIVVESPESLPESYPIECIKDGDIRGSCTTYKTRKCITSVIRCEDGLLMPLSQVIEKWNEKLVLVASPKVRLLSLIGTETNPLVELSVDEYCLLERIGRSRYHGEVTQGEGGLLKLKAPFCKQLHYYRKKLTLKGLVTKQLHYLKSRKGFAITGSLFHLTRFYVQRKTKMELLMKCMCDILKDKPQNRETSRKLREELNIKETTFKKLFYRPSEWVKIANIPYREYNPLASEKESFNCHGQERLVKVVQLLRHCDEVDNVEDEESNEKEQFLPLNVHFDASKIYHELPLLVQTHRLIQEAGPEGLTSGDVGRLITFPKLDVRTILKTLMKKNLIVTVLQERGRQKETKYIARNFGEQNEAYSIVEKGEKYIKEDKTDFSNGKRKAQDSSDILPSNKKIRFEEVEKTVHEKLGEQSSNDGKSSDLVDFQKIISEVSEIQSSDAFTGKAPKLLSMTEKVGKCTKVSDSYRMTYRKLKRMNMILDNLNESGFSTLTDLQKYLIEKEKQEGYNFRIDKKSTARMIHRLYLAKKLKIFKAVLILGSQKAEIEFVCNNTLNINDPCIQVAVEQAKFKFFSLSKDSKKPDKDISAEISDKKDNGDNQSSKKLEEINTNSLLNHHKLRELEMHPKFLRFKTLHKFLYYLVYDYEGHSSDNSQDPIVYHDSMSWKRFVPPLPIDRKNGWCFLADIYNRMPLSVFAKVVNLRYRIKEFAEYLVDEEKCNYLITYLPNDMLKSLLIGRRYLFAIDEVIKYLCYMGLITYGPQVSKMKDQMYIYVHKKSAIQDTTISTPGYLHINPDLTYEKNIFSFNTLNDVEKFWVELENISSNTPLGKYSSVMGKTIAVAEANYKPELLETLKHKNFNEVSDIGTVPGDGLGAGGFDSSLFLHTRRNWQSQNFNKESEKVDKITSNAKSTISIQNLLKNKEVSGPEKRSRLQRLGRLHTASTKDKSLKENFVKKNKTDEITKKRSKFSSLTSPLPVIPKTRVKFRTVKTRKKKIRTPYLDEKDKAAIEKMSMSRSRCEWSAQEDSFLLLCKVASSFLDPSSRTIVVPYTVVRDLLHEKFPELGTNKTSRACQRRVRYMMLNPTTMNNVAVFLGEAKQDMELVKDFDKVKPPKSQEIVWKDLFTGVLKRLLEKFTLPAADRCKNISLPESMEILEQSFRILSPRNVFHPKSNHKNPDNEEELKYCVLYSLIVSAMAIIHDGTEWSYLLYKLYHFYPEFVLRSVVSQLRSEKVIACKKKTCKKDLKPSLMTTFPYRFSITYENAMITKFPIKFFIEAKELLDKFKLGNDDKNIELSDNIDPGFTAAVLSLVLLNDVTLSVKIPEQVILFDSTLSKEARSNIVERMMHSLSDKESDELSRILNEEKDFPLEEKISSDDQNMNEDPLLRELEKPENTPQTNEIQRSTNASRFALYLLRQESSQPPIERVQHSQDYIVLNSCRVVCHLKFPSTSEVPSGNISKNQDGVPLQTGKNEHRGKILTDGCISEIKDFLCACFPSDAFNQYQSFEETLEVIYDAYSPQTLSNAKCIFEEILKAGTIGIPENVIWKKFVVLTGELSLFEHLHLFREALLVVRAGVSSFVYVCICYAKSWVLQSYVMPDICYKKKNEVNEDENLDNESPRNEDNQKPDLTQNIEENNATLPDNFMATFSENTAATPNADYSPINFTEQIYFLPRTWRHPDGTLNKKVFLQLLQTVLSYVIHSPGVSTSRIIDRFSLILQPVQILELLEILEKACCVVKYYCKKTKKNSLFSLTSSVIITKNPEPDDLDHFEPLPDAICNLTRIQEAIM